MYLNEEDAFWALAQLLTNQRHAMHGKAGLGAGVSGRGREDCSGWSVEPCFSSHICLIKVGEA